MFELLLPRDLRNCPILRFAGFGSGRQTREAGFNGRFNRPCLRRDSSWTLPPILVVACLLLCRTALAQSQPAQTKNGKPELEKLLAQGQSLIVNGKPAEAEKVLRKAATRFPQADTAHFLLGYALHAQKKFDQALESYAKARSSTRFKARSLYNIACIYSLKNQPEKALDVLESAIQAGFANFGQLETDNDLKNIRNHPRFKKLIPVRLPDEKLFVEPTRIIHSWNGESAGDQFGWTARKAGDVDRDGVEDFVATAPTWNQGAGKIYVYSSKSGKLLWSARGEKGDRLGNSATGIGDVDGDKIPDIIAGAPASGGTGKVQIYSGRTGKILRSISGNKKGGQFGYEVTGTGDINGDGTPDFFVGEMVGDGKQKGTGRGIVYSGRDGKVIFSLAGERSGDCFGNAAAVASLGDGQFLLAIGAQNAGENRRGRVYVYKVDSASPELKFTIESDQNDTNLGQMFISFPGDLDRDGIPDVYASDFGDRTKAPGGGKIVVHSGATGKQLLAIYGKVAREGLGTSPSDAGDVDGDGIGDLVIGAWQNGQGAVSGGKVYLYSSAGGGKLLRSWTSRQSGDTLGFDACGIGDVDGDGFVDFLLTAAWSNAKGPKTGRIFIVAGEDHSGKSPAPARD